jgi:DUSP domain
MLYLIDEQWIQKWIEYLRSGIESPDYINNERLYNMIFETGQVNDLKINEDFILVHKNLFEYLYGIYGCDYFIQAKQFKV